MKSESSLCCFAASLYLKYRVVMQEVNKESTIRILRENDLWAKKKFGQNFLVSQSTLENIVKNADILDKDFILEIGPGLGFLTNMLSERAKLVLTIEKDRDLVDYLRRKFKGSNVKIVADNALFFDERNIKEDYKIVANLPYNITSAFLRKFLTSENKPKEMVLMMQKEVAERIGAKPGNSERGFLTVMTEYYTQSVVVIENVDREKFWPVPNVDSAVVKLKIANSKQPTANSQIDSEKFLKFVKVGFSQKRRQIHHPLKAGLKLPKDEIVRVLDNAKIDPGLRAEDLSLGDWKKLYQQFSK